MKKENNLVYILIMSLIVGILIALLVIINVKGPLLKKDNKSTKTTTTTKVIEKINNLEEIDAKINIEGVEEVFKAKVYTSNLGFKINYDSNFFTLKEEDSYIIFINNYNENNYVKVEKLSKDDYYLQYENDSNQEHDDEKEGYTYTYKFFRSGEVYLKVTESLIDNPEYEGLLIRMDYIVNSLYITEE